MAKSTWFYAVMVTALSAAGCAKQAPAEYPSADGTSSGERVSNNPSTVADPLASPAQAIEPAPVSPVAGAGTGGTMDAVKVDPPQPLTDAQIVKVTAAVDKGEIDQAKEVQKKAKNPDVKKYAAEMVQYHTKSQQKGQTLAKKAQIAPEESTVCADLTSKAEGVIGEIKAAPAPVDAERAYIDAQVAQHEEVLQLIQTRLIPDAKNAELKAQLEATRTVVEKHVEQARKVQQSMQNPAG